MKTGKILFDAILSVVCLLALCWLMFICLIVSAIDTGSSGVFTQLRIGQFGKKFTIYKFRTYHKTNNTVSLTGRFLRKYKLDELPQVFNVLNGSMSFVGPRPDIEGYYDKLKGNERKLLQLKPGITGPASLKYYNEEYLLSLQNNPQRYNDEVIFPDKVKINMLYLNNYSIILDLKIIYYTIFMKRFNNDIFM